MTTEADKGKLIYESSPESRLSRGVGILLFFVFVSGFFAAIFATILCPMPPNTSWIGYHWPDLLISGGILSGAFLTPTNFFGLRYVVYENGITLPVSFFYNMFRKDREGRFLPYDLILGYEFGLDDPVKSAKDRKKDVSVISIYFWDTANKKIMLAMFGQNLKDLEVVEENFLKKGVAPLPKNCPKCGKELLGFDYLYNRCEKCGTEIFKLPEGAKIMPWIERRREMRKR